ncbi:hypothetical protein B4U79_09763, partial [Dinothrombium tinctorium]
MKAKDETFSSLRNFRPQNQNEAALRILEIGIGSGVNFKYYPSGSVVIGVDPNANFSSDLAKSVKKHDVNLEKLFHCNAENMSEIADESVDAVVTSLVMCYVSDPDVVLKEIGRVLRGHG